MQGGQCVLELRERLRRNAFSQLTEHRICVWLCLRNSREADGRCALFFQAAEKVANLIKWMGRVSLVAGSLLLRRTLTGLEHFVGLLQLLEGMSTCCNSNYSTSPCGAVTKRGDDRNS